MLQSLLPIDYSFLGQGLQGSNKNDLPFGIVFEHSEHGELGHDGLTGSCWGADQYVRVGVIQSVEGLGLHWIKEFELWCIKLLKLGIS